MTSHTKGTVLFVDDDTQSLVLYRRKFEDIFRVLTAENGHDALGIIMSENVDAVVSDLRMPGMDGIQLLKQIRSNHPKILRVIVTAYDDYERIVDSLNNGAINHSFKKPLNINYLKLVLEEQLDKERVKENSKEIIDSVKVYSKELSEKLKARTEELREAYRLLEESDRRYKYAVKAAKQGIIDWGISNDALILNDVFFENLGYDRRDMFIRNLEDLKHYIHTDDRVEFFDKLKKYMKSGGTMEMRVRLLSKSETYVWHNFVGLVVEWDQKNRPVRFIGACLDISRQMSLEDKLKAANEDLRMIGDMKHNFIANVSHELRTPMNAILGFASLYDETSDASERAGYVGHIKSAAQSLNQVIDNMIAYASLEQDETLNKVGNFKLDKLLQEIGSHVSGRLVKKGIEYTVEIGENIPVYLMGNESGLKKALLAILDNSVKFTKEGRVDLRVHAIDHSGGNITLEFKVTDTGIGMDKEQLDYIHIAFKQADGSSSRSYDGLGLGVSIAMDAVRKMNGRLFIESNAGQGTQVTVQIPFKMAYEVHRIRTNLINIGKFKALIYKQLGTQNKELQKMLEGFGFTVTSAQDTEALKLNMDHSNTVQFILGNSEDLEDVRQSVSMDKHIVIAIEDYDTTHVLGWVNASVKKPLVASELYNAFIESLVKYHPKVAKQEIALKVSTKTIERIKDMHILVAEDSLMNRQIMKNILETIKVKADFAEDGEAVLAMDHLEVYDLIFMDINMPGKDGDEVCAELRKQEALKDLPILGLTADMDEESIKHYHEVGMNAVLHKPYNVDEIYRMIETYANVEDDSTQVSQPATEDGRKDILDLDGFMQPLADIGVDVHSAVNRLNGNTETYYTLLKEFKSKYSDWEAQYVNMDNRDVLRASYHGIKGITANLGASDLSQRAGKLEKALSQGNQVAHDSEVRDFEGALNRFLDGIGKVLLSCNQDDCTVTNEAVYDHVEVENIVSSVIEALKENDTAVLDRLKEIELSRFEEDIADALKKTYALVQQFDFDTALQIMMDLVADHPEKGRE